jgi:hypothetical protein
MDVARECGLRHREPPARQYLAQLLLVGQGPFVRKLDNHLLPGQFHNE